MEIEEALKIVAQVCAEFRGTLKDHTALQNAIQELTKGVNSLKALKKEDKPVKVEK